MFIAMSLLGLVIAIVLLGVIAAWFLSLSSHPGEKRKHDPQDKRLPRHPLDAGGGAKH
jgi:hypothetical protein